MSARINDFLRRAVEIVRARFGGRVSYAFLEVFEAEGVDAAFVYTFARYDLPHREDPRADLDMASRGVVKVLDGQQRAGDRRYPDMPWEPKAAFTTLADCYGDEHE